MNPAALETNASQVYRGIDPQRLAWGVLLVAFVIFCVFCVIIGLLANYFLFQSNVSLDAQLVVGRNYAGIFEPSSERLVPDETVVTANTVVSTAPQSQATFYFFDTSRDNRIIAHVRLRGTSSATLRTASRPRFEWSTTNYVIDLANISGEFDVVIAENVDRNVLLYLQTGTGVKPRVNLQGAGHYLVDSTENRLRVFNLRGNAFLLPDEAHGYSIPAGQQGVFYTDSNSVEIKAGYINLLKNSNFELLNENVNNTTELLSGWLCSNDPEDNPPGSYRSQMYEGRMTLRLERYQGATTHGRTFCSQSFGSTALDVKSLEYLALRATFYIHHQSLAVCGFQGSECPLMLRVDYRDAQGEARQWFHGFYTRMDPQMSHPLRCLSCSQEHELINANSWYTYDSGNLLNLFPADETQAVSQQISEIIGIWFYASGHEYDVQLSEVALLGQPRTDPVVLPAQP